MAPDSKQVSQTRSGHADGLLSNVHPPTQKHRRRNPFLVIDMRLICTPISFAAITVLAIQLTASVMPAGAASSNGVVNCYDRAREMVMRVNPADCEGSVVSDAEANAIRARRRAYVRESLDTNVDPSVLGKRLVNIGAGFFVNAEGAMLTNAHVVEDCATLTVSRPDGSLHQAKRRAADTRTDLALISVDFQPLHYAAFAPPDASFPTEIAIIGYPNQGLPPIVPLLTSGTLAAEEALRSPSRPITIKADIRPGNSGGPILDRYGRVVGVVFAAIDTVAVYERTQRLVRNVGMAIPNAISLRFLEQQGIEPAISEPTTPRNDLHDAGRRFVARIECWR